MNTPQSSPANVFEFLDASHRGIQRHLRNLRTVVNAIEDDTLTSSQKELAKQVLNHFNSEARQHHIDEEMHIFPALLNSQDAHVAHTARHLVQDHGWLEENWLQIEPALEAAANGNQWFDMAELRHAVDVFDALYTDHLMLEESLAYPEAKKRLDACETAGMGREMAKRRAFQATAQT